MIRSQKQSKRMSSGARTAIVATSLVLVAALGLQVRAQVETESAPAESAASATRVPPPPPAGTILPTEEHPESYLEFALAGGYLMIPIALLSVVWLTFLIERLTALRRARVFPRALASDLSMLQPGKTDGDAVERILTERDSSCARIVRTAAKHLGSDRENIEFYVNDAAQREVHKLRRFIGVFAVIASVAPLLGLLGTVTGMIQAFREVALEGLGSGQALAPGIYQALVTTAAGLIVAIPALVTYHWLHSRIDNYLHSINALVVDFVEARGLRGAAS